MQFVLENLMLRILAHKPAVSEGQHRHSAIAERIAIIFHVGYILIMEYLVLYTNIFETWWQTLNTAEKTDILASVYMLQSMGPNLPFPYSSGIQGSAYSHMRELRIQHRGKPYRVLYAFDPKRQAILLCGGNKIGKEKRWYKQNIPIADEAYRKHLEELEKGDSSDQQTFPPA